MLLFASHKFLKYTLDIGQNNAQWNYQWWLLSWFPLQLCFLQRNYSYGTKISTHFIDISSKLSSLFILFKFGTCFMLYLTGFIIIIIIIITTNIYTGLFISCMIYAYIHLNIQYLHCYLWSPAKTKENVKAKGSNGGKKQK